jgi:hypothetical protein
MAGRRRYLRVLRINERKEWVMDYSNEMLIGYRWEAGIEGLEMMGEARRFNENAVAS